MHSLSIRQLWTLCALAALCAGCGTTRRSDTVRTATEQMLLSDAVDRAISRIDFGLLAGKEVYFDNTYLGSTVDKEYITSTLRQHMLACGCILKDKKEEAELVVEARAGVVGTDRNDVLFGTPATSVSLGALSPLPGTPTQVPEIALAKRTDQMGVAKIAVFAYERATGAPVWQSGTDAVASRARDLWVFGTGPFQRGSIYDGPKFAGEELHVPLIGSKKDNKKPPVRVARERVFNSEVLARDGAATKAADRIAAETDPAAGGESAVTAAEANHLSAQADKSNSVTRTAAAETTPAANLPRSQFDALWATTPLERQDANTATADRRWPPMSQTQ
ncbi:MAG: DUF6655 family protein [Pirellulales bacterium]